MALNSKTFFFYSHTGDRFGMVFYNNLLSATIILPLCFMKGELGALFNPEIMTPNFIMMNVIAGFLGFYLNFASLWCVAATSATTYAIVGKCNLLLVP
jgi:GDP-mannose transporter